MKHLGKPLKEIIVEPLVMPEPLRKEVPADDPGKVTPEREPVEQPSAPGSYAEKE